MTSKSLSVSPSASKQRWKRMSAEFPWSMKTRQIVASMRSMEITKGGFRVSVVLPISSEENVISGGGLSCSVLGMTSTARHECLLLLAAFRDGGFPSSGSPPEIILISLLVTLSLGSSFLSVDFSGLSTLCLVLLSSLRSSSGEFTELSLLQTFLDKFEE
ncbi:hypothetical protein PIB30_021735 [Stylosanthes scabra]|uniref:Uncharacterized protein n=1 Tax=Stylosanthes scabra TaxID=79078 RepID=A0ABU6T8T8_9FABA|nr:hypothetical protein [Stylosanthes scabra]